MQLWHENLHIILHDEQRSDSWQQKEDHYVISKKDG